MNVSGAKSDTADGPWELPQGWAWTALATVTDPVTTIDPRREIPTEAISYVDLSSLGDGRIVTPQVLDGQDAPLRARQVIQAGDTLFSNVRVYLSNIGLVEPTQGKQVASTAYCVLRPSAAVHPRYVFHFVRSRRFIDRLIPLQRGNSPPAVVDSDVKAQPLPLPPLPEQCRIVERIDALFTEIAEGELALAEARKGLDLFRRALLKAAVSGELTKDWRAANPQTETGSDLLAHISKRRGADSGKERYRRTREARSFDVGSLPHLPAGWAWAVLSEIAQSVRNGTSAPPRSSANGNEILRISAVRPMRVDETQIRFLDDAQAKFAAEATVESGDLLFTRYNGSADLVGVGAVYKGPRRFYPDKIIRVRLESPLLPQVPFVELAVNGWIGRKHIAANIKTTAGQQGISGESLKDTPTPIPPPDETAEILSRFSEALAAADDAEKLLDAEAGDAARLRQSILKSAFEGRLVPQDPADEPASALLARLGAAEPGSGQRRRGRATPHLLRRDIGSTLHK